MNSNSRIFVAGHRGMVGSAIVRHLESKGYTNLILSARKDLDLRSQQSVMDFFAKQKPEFVFLAAAKVGGIMANNTYRAEFLFDNLMIASNIIEAAHRHETEKLLFLGSSCIYPKLAPQPLKEEHLLTGLLEETNEPYAIAKIAGIKLCEAYRDQYGCNFISAMPTNLYGKNDNYDLHNSHVLPALLKKFHAAKKAHSPTVEVWGTGEPLREFLYVDDLAEACLHLMLHYNEKQFINVGSGTEITIRDLALLIKKITGYEGEIFFDTTKPNGTPRKIMDVSRLESAGWKFSTQLEDGIRLTYEHALRAGKLE